MAFVEPVTLRDRGIRLEPLALSHEHGLAAAAADGELWKLRITSVPEPQDTRAYIEAALKMREDGNRFAFAVVDDATGKVLGSTSQRITSTSLSVRSATLTMYSPSLFFALWIPGVSRKMICPSSQVYTVWILFLVVCGFLDVIAIFCPIRWFIRVDFPTFGLPMIATNPDLKFSFICSPLLYQRFDLF